MGRIMSNFDVLVGLSEAEVSRFIAEYHSNPPTSGNPFKGRHELEVLGQSAVIEWDVVAAPQVILAKPDCEVWLVAQGRDGLTNEEANRQCPNQPMLQLKFPQLDLEMGLVGSEFSRGTARDVIAHAKLNFQSSTIGIELVAISVDKSEFEDVDKQLFNLLVLPLIFEKAEHALSVIHLP